MSIDRAETAGLGIAAAGHVLLFAILSAGFLATKEMPKIERPSMEVQLVDEVALDSAAPTVSNEAPAPKLAEIEGPAEPAAPAPPVPEPLPQPQPTPVPPAPPPPAPKTTPRPAPQPKPAPAKPTPAKPAPPKPAAKAKPSLPPPARPQPKAAARPSASAAAPATKVQPKQARPTGRLSGILTGISDRDSPSKATTPPARTASAAVRSSLAGEIRRQLKPHWKAPTGADAELLRTELSISLAPNGKVTNVEVLRTTGQTASNRPQVKLHQEQAVRAVRLASPFKLPAEYYDAWKLLSPIGFDKRLSQ